MEFEIPKAVERPVGIKVGKSWKEIDLAKAIDWALENGADVLNASFGEPVPPGATGNANSDSRLFDFLVFEHMRAVTAAAGNEGQGDFVCSPASGYNVIAVGGIDDKGTVSWADDKMYDLKPNDGSNSVNPTFPAGGREKPDVCAVAVGVRDATAIWKGTSFAAPAVAGTIALLIQRQPWLAVWPEVTKAVVMASAIHNVTGASRVDDWEGAGTVVASEADNVVMSNWLWKKVAGKVDFPITIKFNVTKGPKRISMKHVNALFRKITKKNRRNETHRGYESEKSFTFSLSCCIYSRAALNNSLRKPRYPMMAEQTKNAETNRI